MQPQAQDPGAQERVESGSYREAAFDIAFVGCAPRKAQRCLAV